MNAESLFIDIDYAQKIKQKQNVCGDFFISKRYADEGRLIAVLSDGLGSGIKANILSTITATMILEFIAAGRNLLKAAEVVMNSLPVCQVRKISYATFSLIDCMDDGTAKVVEEGNPTFLLVRNNEIIDIEPQIVTSQVFPEKQLNVYEFKLQPEDRLIFSSDGVTQAGLGSDELKLGWRRSGLINFVLEKLKYNKNISSRQLAMEIVHEAELKEPEKTPKDDISAAVLYFRHPRKLMIFTGPPYYSDRDSEYAHFFDSFKGKKVLCGGTTANLVSRELNRKIISEDSKSIGNLPACSKMDGVDLITEGILTLTRAVEYLESNINDFPVDSAGKLVNILLDSDCIEFMVGAKVNQAHYDPDLPVELEIRKNVIKRLVKVLEHNYLKKVTLKFI